MGYNNQQYNNNFRQNQQRRNNNYNSYEIKKISEPLSVYYKDKTKLYLPDGVAYQYALKFSRIPSHQLRKILNQVKLCKADLQIDMNVNDVRCRLFSLLPLSAYNAGRDKSLKVLYEFLVEHINNESIKGREDILLFDDLFTSVVAFHKYISK